MLFLVAIITLFQGYNNVSLQCSTNVIFTQNIQLFESLFIIFEEQ